MNAISVLNQLPETKEQVKTYVENAKEHILAGNENPLLIARQLKAFEDVIKELRKDTEIKEATLIEAEKYEGKSFEFANCNFQIKETGTKYDFSDCNDSTLQELYKSKESIDKKIKARETMLKSLIEPMGDTNTGELLNPPVKKSTTSLVVILK